ncbi:hypothetical protein ISS07_03855 [Candidatus Woesearchaeota archaeon]|nr:hypothetical protein [Candidatus Woesearchaeota archaeon]
MEKFYGPKPYYEMIAFGKIARGARLFLFQNSGDERTLYFALNQSTISRNGSRSDPENLLEDRIWAIPKEDINPFEKFLQKNTQKPL